MKKRILSISAQKPNSTGSGVYLTELVNAWNELGHGQMVIAGVELGESVQLPKGVQFMPVLFKNEELPFPVVGMSDVMPYDNTRYCDLTDEMLGAFCNAFRKRIQEALNLFQPDMVVCHHLYVTTAIAQECVATYNRRKGTQMKIFGICHSTCLRQYQKNTFLKASIKNAMHELDGIFALHEGQKREISKIFEVEEAKIQIVGAGYNDSIFPKEINRTAEKIVLCFAGKVSQAKGVKSLIRAMQGENFERPVVLILAGGTGDEKEYKEIVEMAKQAERPGKLEVQFAGKVPQKELGKIYRTSHIFVLPSFYEGLPLTLLEAMGSGCLAVAADWNGVPAWLQMTAPEAKVEFVHLPGMSSPGVPWEKELPAYEKELAKAIKKQMQLVQNGEVQVDVQELTWKRIAQNILEIS